MYSVTGEAVTFAPKAARSGKKWICILIQTKRKRPTSGGGNMLMFHIDVNMNHELGIRLKNDSFQWFRVHSFFWENNYIRFQTLQDVFILLALCYTLPKAHFDTSIIGALYDNEMTPQWEKNSKSVEWFHIHHQWLGHQSIKCKCL